MRHPTVLYATILVLSELLNGIRVLTKNAFRDEGRVLFCLQTKERESEVKSATSMFTQVENMRASMLLWLIWQQLPQPVFPFAHIMLEPNACMTDLDTSEVIMNSPVQAFEESEDPDVQLIVLSDDGEATPLKSPIMLTSVPTSFLVKMVNPNDVALIQFAMDVVGPTGSAHWEQGGCDEKKRLTSSSLNKGHKLIFDRIPDETIEVVAGWATSHEAVSLTNVLVFKPSDDALDTSNTSETEQRIEHTNGEGALDEAIQGMIKELKVMEHAEENEREQEQQYLGDDDAANVGDVEQQLDNVHASDEMKKRLEKMFDTRAEWAGKRKHPFFPDLDKLKERMQEKPRDIAEKWDIIRQEIKKDEDFGNKVDGEEEFTERKRLMNERLEKMQSEKNPEGFSNKLKDLGQRDDRWKKAMQTRREMLAAKSKAPLPNDEFAETQETVNEEDPPYKRRMREIYEEQDSDIALKEVLIGLLGVLIANWLILQICIYREKKRKGRRDL